MNTRNSKMINMATMAIISVLLMSAFMILPPAAFAQPNPACGSDITSDTTLSGDVGPCSTPVGLRIINNNITLDCAGYTISGTNVPFSAGIVSSGFTGVTIKNCNVTGFFQGTYTDFGSNVNLTSNTLDGNTIGIFMQRTTGSTVTGNIADGNSQVGVFMGFSASGNTLDGNIANNNSIYGFEDSTTGSGTSGTGNTYSGDMCSGNTVGDSSPSGLCGLPTFSATFDQNGIPSSGTTWGVTVGSNHYTGTGTSITVSGLLGTLSYNYDSPVAGSAGTHYTCNTGCSGSVSGSGTESASYTTQYLLTVATSPSGLTPAPTISPASSSGYYDAGTPVTLTANTVLGYAFINWQVDGTNQHLMLNTTGVTMNGPHNGTAVYQVPTNGTVTGGGSIGDGTIFGFEVHSNLVRVDPIHGTFVYHDRHAKLNLESNKISFLSVDPTATQATFVGTETHDMHDRDDAHATADTFLVSVTDPDKTGNHDTLSITVTNSTGSVIYQNSGIVQGHIEIHNVDTDNGGGHDDKNNKGNSSH